MADNEAVFVNVWTEKWSKIAVPQQFSSPGAVRRLNIGALLGKTMPANAEAGGKLVDGIFKDLRSVLKDDATFWSSGPGQISVFYPKMVSQAADLTHSVVCSTIERRIHDTVLVPARETAGAAGGATQTAKTERRLSWEDFQRIVRRSKARPDQIQIIDVSELILGKADPAAHLSKRAWRVVDGIVDEFLGAGGYCARQTGNQILLLFPGLSISLARLKRKAIAAEIEASTGAIVRGGEELASDSEEEGDDLPTASKARPEEGESAEEIARLNQAFAALGATSVTTAPIEYTTGVVFHTVPVWRTRNQSLIGHNIFVQSGSGHIPIDLLDLSCLAKAHTDAQDGIAAQSPYLVITQLHWYTLERVATRTRYLELAAKISEAARRYLVFAVHDVPEDLLPARIEDRVRELRPFGRSVSFNADIDRRDFEQLRGQDFYAVGSSLEQSDGDERELMLTMNGLVSALAPLQKKTFMDGLNTKSMVVAAIAAGFDFLSGTAIVAAQEGVQGVRAFSIPDLYMDSGAPTTQGE